jgi:hypothetical protein
MWKTSLWFYEPIKVNGIKKKIDLATYYLYFSDYKSFDHYLVAIKLLIDIPRPPNVVYEISNTRTAVYSSIYKVDEMPPPWNDNNYWKEWNKTSSEIISGCSNVDGNWGKLRKDIDYQVKKEYDVDFKRISEEIDKFFPHLLPCGFILHGWSGTNMNNVKLNYTVNGTEEYRDLVIKECKEYMMMMNEELMSRFSEKINNNN